MCHSSHYLVPKKFHLIVLAKSHKTFLITSFFVSLYSIFRRTTCLHLSDDHQKKKLTPDFHLKKNMSTSPIHTLHIMWAVFAQLLGLAHKVHSHRGVYLVQNWLSSLGNFKACADDELRVNENARGKVVCVCVCVSNKSCIAFKYGTIEGEFSWHFLASIRNV